jgi:O-antigen ligase
MLGTLNIGSSADLERRTLSGEPLYRTSLNIAAVFVVLFASMTFFRIRDYTDKSLDFQVAFKMAAIGLSFIVPIASLIVGRISLSNRLVLAWLAFLLALVGSSFQAPVFSVSFIDSVAFVGCFIFCVWMATRFGETNAATLMILIVAAVAVLSLIVYFVNPELGRMRAWLGSEFGGNNRIRGIAGSPNGLGSMTAMALLLSILYFKRMTMTVRKAVLIVSIPISICLIMTDNRMSFLSLIVCAGLYMINRRNRVAIGLLAALALAALLVLLLAEPDFFMASLSRTGDASEISNGNGRTEIWAVVLEHIARRPLTGYGYAAATSILPLDPRLFSVAAHTHNLYLEVLFSGGIIAFGLFLVAIAMSIYEGLRKRCFEPLIMLFFFLIRGLTEPSPFSNMPTFAGYAFFMSAAFIVVRVINTEAVYGQLARNHAAASLLRCKQILKGKQATA